MSGRLADIETRIGTVRKLAAVVAAMRGIAASRAREARGHVAGIRTFADTIGEAISQSLALLPDQGRDGDRGNTGRRAVVLLAAEQGFAGAFNETVFDAAAPLLGDPHELILAGDRGLIVAEERGLDVDWSAPMIAHAGQATSLAVRITEAIYERLAAGNVTCVTVVHAAPDGPTTGDVVVRPLVPFDFSRFPAPLHGAAPLITLPAEDLLTRLAEEYVFAEITEAIMLSFVAENEARTRAMIAAHDNVSKSLDQLVAQSRLLRQEEITDEITELATSSLPIR
ncbi:F0F1 ATP synthase subunit gamma [Tropicimonas marinistellae]|uniref:F0F1 ATP synthase subunit gamma n=1 Tax=Tropicimonas marinistellae TaxID=1739787 RepID=UPI0008320816|nr:FoF1 ATP synthase subunit gamma [Tropicimonas marinistellae]